VTWPQEISRRAGRHLRDKHLVVDYYRIGQTLCFDLPVGEFPSGCSRVDGIPDYPFAIWVLWQLEERLLALGWNAELNQCQHSARLAGVELSALAGWTRTRQLDVPDLCLAHRGRLLTAALRWKWPSAKLRLALRGGLNALIEDGISALPPLPPGSADDLISSGARLGNISIIGSFGLAMAAVAVKHRKAAHLNARAARMAQAWLALGRMGHLEGVSYDSYTADFLMDWLQTLPLKKRASYLGRGRLDVTLDEIQFLGAPQAPENLAPLGDVEPSEMRFHYSFAAKFFYSGGGAAALPGFAFPSTAPAFLRTDALQAWFGLKPPPPPPAALPCQQFRDVHVGWRIAEKKSNLCMVVSWHHSPMGHMQKDCGSLVIGQGKHWMISDPGYQQYQPGDERDFTIGPRAHNQPIIRGYAAQGRLSDRQSAARIDFDAGVATFDLTELYPPEARLHSVTRTVGSDAQGFWVRDCLKSAKALRQVEYNWHGNPAAAWSLQDGQASLCLNGRRLWLSCRSSPLDTAELGRLPGTRGHLSLTKLIQFTKRQTEAEIEWRFGILPLPAPMAI